MPPTDPHAIPDLSPAALWQQLVALADHGEPDATIEGCIAAALRAAERAGAERMREAAAQTIASWGNVTSLAPWQRDGLIATVRTLPLDPP